MTLDTKERHQFRSVMMNELGLTRDLVRSEARHLIRELVKEETRNASHVEAVEQRVEAAISQCVKSYLENGAILSIAKKEVSKEVDEAMKSAVRNKSVADFLKSKQAQPVSSNTDNAPHHVRIWRFQDAPKELKKLSTNGGDEDWIALIPPTLADGHIGWLEEGHSFGCFCVDEYDHPELPGYKVKIGCHS